MEVYDALARARGSGQRAVLVTVLGVEGAAPTRPGAKVVVVDSTVAAGTLGCAEFDSAAIALAREAMASASPRRRRWTSARHGEEHALELFAEVHEPQPAVLVFGATPVGRAVAALADLIGRRAVLVSPGGDTGVGPRVEVKPTSPSATCSPRPPAAPTPSS